MFGWLKGLFTRDEPLCHSVEPKDDEIPSFVLQSCLYPECYAVGDVVYDDGSNYIITSLDVKNGVITWERQGE